MRDGTTREYVTEAGPNVEVMYMVRCPPGSGAGHYEWAPIANYVDPQVVIDAAYDSAVADIPLPSLDLWPAPEFGVPVNYGMWLAVNDPGQVNAYSEVGPVWASVTARFTGATYDMGNGDVVDCAGLGTAYYPPADPTDARPGPCGYTYTRTSDLGLRHVVVTGHWDVQLVTSTGRNEALDPIDMTFEFDYEVYEIQAILVDT